MVTGLVPTMLVGALGGLISELIRVAPTMKKDKKFPSRVEFVVSVIYVALGAGVALFGWNDPKAVLALVIQGAAFPAVFANIVNSASTVGSNGTGIPSQIEQQPTRGGERGGQRTRTGTRVSRSVIDYMAGRF